MENSSYSQNSVEDNRIDIDYISIIRGILKQWWVILLITIGTYMFAYVYIDSQYEPQYTTTTTFSITKKGTSNSTYANAQGARDTAEKFTLILGSYVLQKNVAEELGMDYLQATVDAKVITETNLVVLSVTADSAYDSFRILQCMVNNHSLVSQHLLSDIIMDTIQPATIPTSPNNYNDSSKRAFMVAAVVMAVLMVIFGCVGMIRDTIKSSGEMTKKLDAKSLGVIVHERKRKTVASIFKKQHFNMLINNPLLSFRYVECYQLLAARLRSRMKRAGHKVLLVTSVMENEGKSTVASNIALSIAESGEKVLLVDCDMRKPAQYKIFEIDKKSVNSLGDALQKKEGAESLITKIDKTKIFGIFNTGYQRRSTELIGERTLRDILAEAKENFDYIIIDSSPMALVADAEALARYADASLLVVRYDYVLTKDINDIIDVLNMQKAKFMGCVLNNAVQAWSRSDAGYAYEYSRKRKTHGSEKAEE